MIVNIEFFDKNPIENVITSLNYRVDKTIFFGYQSEIEKESTHIEAFLKNTCGVSEVDFCVVDEMDLAMTMSLIQEKVEEHYHAGCQVFFDLTGGESIPLVAFGILSKELNAPMHKYDIWKNEMFEYGYEGTARLSEVAEYDPLTLNLDQYISIFGGTIDYQKQKGFKHIWSDTDEKEVQEMWEIYQKYHDKWLYYSNFLRAIPPKQGLLVAKNESDFLKEFHKNPQIGSIKQFQSFLEDCRKAGFIRNLSYKEKFYRFEYIDSTVKNYFWDGGSILEMYAYLQVMNKQEINDCRVGVHIDWDGVLHDAVNMDVLNEIDILAIENNLPIFISCKIGKADQMALYELSAIAERFGGKYAKKILVISKEIAPVHYLRAKEMGIEIRMMGQ